MRIEAGDAWRQTDVLFARMLVKAMRSTLRDRGPLAGGAGARLFGEALETALAEAVASGRGWSSAWRAETPQATP